MISNASFSNAAFVSRNSSLLLSFDKVMPCTSRSSVISQSFVAPPSAPFSLCLCQSCTCIIEIKPSLVPYCIPPCATQTQSQSEHDCRHGPMTDRQRDPPPRVMSINNQHSNFFDSALPASSRPPTVSFISLYWVRVRLSHRSRHAPHSRLHCAPLAKHTPSSVGAHARGLDFDFHPLSSYNKMPEHFR